MTGGDRCSTHLAASSGLRATRPGQPLNRPSSLRQPLTFIVSSATDGSASASLVGRKNYRRLFLAAFCKRERRSTKFAQVYSKSSSVSGWP